MDTLEQYGVKKLHQRCMDVVKKLFPNAVAGKSTGNSLAFFTRTADTIADEIRDRFGDKPNRSAIARQLRVELKVFGEYHSTMQCMGVTAERWHNDTVDHWWSKEGRAWSSTGPR